MRDSTNTYIYNLVQSYAPSSNTISISGSWSPYTNRETSYNIMNHPAYLDRPGEYVYKYSENRIYIWPRNNGDPNNNSYEVAQERIGFLINGQSNITVRGFQFEGLHSLPGVFDTGIAVDAISDTVSSNLLIENNIITKIRAMKYAGTIRLWNCVDSVVQNNTIEYCQNSIGVLAESSQNILVRNNRIDRASKVGVWFQHMRNSQITRNFLRGIQNLHSNGITVYLDCSDILIAGNQVWQSQNPIALKDSHNIYIIDNLLDGTGAYSIAEWSGNISGDMYILNNTAVNASAESRDSNDSILLTNAAGANYVVMNNVLDGMLVVDNGSLVSRSHNVYTALNYTQDPNRGWNLQEGEQVQYTDLNQLFTNYTQGDYSPASNSPLNDRGRDVRSYHPMDEFPQYDFTKDLAGNSIGNDFSIGAYEGPDNQNESPASLNPAPAIPRTDTPIPVPVLTLTPTSILTLLTEPTFVTESTPTQATIPISEPVPSPVMELTSSPTSTPTITPTPEATSTQIPQDNQSNDPVIYDFHIGGTRVSVYCYLPDNDWMGGEIEVTLTIVVEEPLDNLAIQKELPEGWFVTSSSLSTEIRDGNKIRWLLPKQRSTTIQYKIHIPEGAYNPDSVRRFSLHQLSDEKIQNGMVDPDLIDISFP